MELYYEMANYRLFRIDRWDRATSAELLTMHGSTPRR
jgi:hypothetical protein